MKLSNKQLQEHIHYVGLSAFLDQLKEVLNDCSEEMVNINLVKATQYENAADETATMKELIFFEDGQ